MFDRALKTISRVVTIAAAVLTFLLAMELIRAYQTLYGLHPWAGYAFAVAVAAGVFWLAGLLMGGWRHRPRTLKCPVVGDHDQADAPSLRRYGKYLGKYLSRLSINVSLTDDQRAQAAAAALELPDRVRACLDVEELRAVLRHAEAQHVETLLADLDAKCESEISQCVRDVMIGVAASPWPLVDALIVLYRNGSMVNRITHIYNSRPASGTSRTARSRILRIMCASFTVATRRTVSMRIDNCSRTAGREL